VAARVWGSLLVEQFERNRLKLITEKVFRIILILIGLIAPTSELNWLFGLFPRFIDWIFNFEQGKKTIIEIKLDSEQYTKIIRNC